MKQMKSFISVLIQLCDIFCSQIIVAWKYSEISWRIHSSKIVFLQVKARLKRNYNCEQKL